MPIDRFQAALWAAAGFVALWLLYRLGPVLSPFLLAAILAYICNPLVDRLNRQHLNRTAAVLVVMLLFVTLVGLLVLAVTPLLRDETQQIIDRLPDLIGLINDQFLPWVYEHTGIRFKFKFSPAEVKQFLSNNWGSIQAVLEKLLESAQTLFQIAANLLLAPIAMFYLLRDWNLMRHRLARFIPRPWHEKAMVLADEVDNVLAEFLRGQLSVMALLSIYYSIALWVARVHFAVPLGLITGLLVFVPYLGFATGLTLALLVGLLQFEGWAPIAGVLIVYGIGQILESFILTPLLMGKRIGLHPLAVIFALLAFGELFGFFGVLLALPASAILLVGLRHVRAIYITSRFYRGSP